MAEYKRGEMNVKTQEADFDLFVKNSFRIAVVIAVILWLMWVFLV